MSILKAFDTKGAIISTPPSTGLSIILLCCIGRSSCWITKIESEVWKLEVSCVSVFSVFFACEWPSFLPFLLDHWTLGFISRLLCPLMVSPSHHLPVWSPRGHFTGTIRGNSTVMHHSVYINKWNQKDALKKERNLHEFNWSLEELLGDGASVSLILH